MAKFNMNDLLNSQSKAERPEVEQFEIKHIKIEKLVPSENNKYGIRHIEEMAENIDMIGLLHNLAVKKIENSDMYEIISGERRFRGIQMLYERGKTEWSTVPCKVESNKDDIFTELKLLFGNSMARDLTDYEKTYQAGRIKELLTELKKTGYKLQGRMREIVAETLDISPAQMGRMESINEKLVPELKEAFKEERINITTAYEASRLTEEKQIKAADELNTKGALDIKAIKKVENEKKAETDPEEVVKSLKDIAEGIWNLIDKEADIKKLCKEAAKIIEKGIR